MTNKITELNDAFRKKLNAVHYGKELGRYYITAGVQALAPELQMAIISEVRNFTAFPKGDDPYGEHDFGAFSLPGAGRIYWKIDYYDLRMEGRSPDPADESQTVRVLTIMQAQEY